MEKKSRGVTSFRLPAPQDESAAVRGWRRWRHRETVSAAAAPRRPRVRDNKERSSPPPLPTAILFAISCTSFSRSSRKCVLPRPVYRNIDKHFAQRQHEEDQGCLRRGRLRGGRSGRSGGRGRLRGGLGPRARSRGKDARRAPKTTIFLDSTVEFLPEIPLEPSS